MNQEFAEQAVAQLVDAWAAAEVGGDAAFLESTLTDDFIGIGPLGFLLTKQEWIGRHQSGDLKYEVLTLDEVKARLYHDTAIVIGRQAQQGAYRGNPINAQFRTTLVFVMQDGQWRLANFQLSAIGQPPNVARS